MTARPADIRSRSSATGCGDVRSAANDDAIGQRVRINSHPFTVIGVAPPGFVGVSLDNLPELWMPMAMAAEAMPEIAQDFKPLSRATSTGSRSSAA